MAFKLPFLSKEKEEGLADGAGSAGAESSAAVGALPEAAQTVLVQDVVRAGPRCKEF